MDARVLVVRLDDVGQDHRGAAVRVAQLKCAVDALLTLPREHRQEHDQRHHEDHRDPVLHRGERGEQPEGREQEVDAPHPLDAGELVARPDPELEPPAWDVHHKLAGELSPERREIERPLVERRLAGSGRHEHQGRTQGIPRVAQGGDRPLGMPAAAEEVGCRTEKSGGGHEQRNARGRQEEEHRDEYELRRSRVGGADRELDPEGDEVEEHEPGGQRRRERSLPGREDGEQHGRDDEARGNDRLADTLAVRERLGSLRARALQLDLGFGIEQRAAARPVTAQLVKCRYQHAAD